MEKRFSAKNSKSQFRRLETFSPQDTKRRKWCKLFLKHRELDGFSWFGRFYTSWSFNQFDLPWRPSWHRQMLKNVFFPHQNYSAAVIGWFVQKRNEWDLDLPWVDWTTAKKDVWTNKLEPLNWKGFVKTRIGFVWA